MAHLTWLHLSDWHQSGKDFDRRVVRDKLIEDLAARQGIDSRLSGIDFIIFSGDIAFFGLAEEYEAARENLFDPVLRATGLTSESLFMVPGNHDLSRDTVYEMLPPELQSTIDSDALVNKWLTDEKKLRRVLEPFEAYIQFVDRYTGQPQPAFASVRQLNVNGVDVAILGLNSAWMSGRNKDGNGEVNDYGHLLVGEPQIHDALGQISDATVRISVLHHPFKWLKGFEQGKIEGRLKQACHFILHGHEHEPGADLSRGLQGECMTVPGGASYERRKAHDPRYVNAYNLVHLDLESAAGVVFFREWSERRTAWIADLDSHKDGKFDFTLPEQLGCSNQGASLSNTSGVAVNPLAAIEADYRRQTIETFKDLSFKGLTASVRPIRLPLEKVYVQLRAVAEVPESADEFTPEERRVLRWMEEEREGQERPQDLREAELRLDALRRERWTKDRLERFPIADALKDSKRRGLVILGDPGSGKSTLLHFLNLTFARGPEVAAEQLEITLEEANRLPIFAPLAAYDDMLNHDGTLTIRDFLAKYYAQRRAMPGLEGLFETAIDSGRALILLDGMDEVLDESRRKFIADQASAFIRALIYRGNRVLLTSRIYGYRVAPLSVEMPHVTVLDFRREEIAVFARQWNLAMAEWEYAESTPEERNRLAKNDERTLLEEINSNPGVERLAANPLLLSMLALLRRQVGRLPQQRIRLYALYLGTLIDAWEASRSPGARVDSPTRSEAGRAELILIPLALWLQQNKPSGTATEVEILTQIIAVFLREQGLPSDTPEDSPEWRESETRARGFLDDMRSFSGLLVERGQGAFGFRHLTFQEYYVGRALARMEASQRWELLHPNLHANRWREPILLAAAQLGTIQTDDEACTTLVSNILGAQSPHEDVLHRDLLLAADCAGDDINVGILCLRQIVDRLKPQTLSPIPSLATDAIRRLVALASLSSAGKPRLPEAVEVLLETVSRDESSSLPVGTLVTLVSSLFQSFPSVRVAVALKLNDESHSVEVSTIQALAPFLADNPNLRDAVALKLNDERHSVRVAAITALAGLLADNANLRNAVALKLNDEMYLVQAEAIRALAGLLVGDARLRETIALKLNDELDQTRVAAIQALAGLLADNASLRNAVALKLNDEMYLVQVEAIRALAGLLVGDARLRETITLKLNDEVYRVRVAAIRALAGLLADNPNLRDAVALKLNDPADDVRVAAIESLAGLLSAAPELRDVVALKLNDEVHSVRAAAMRGIVPFRTHKNLIVGLLRHRDWRTRRDTVLVLAETLAGDPDLTLPISKVLDELQCQEASLMQAATIQALSCLLATDLNLREAAVLKLNDEAPVVRAAVIQALASFLNKDFKLRDAVTLKLNDEAPLVRVAAIRALAGFLNDELNLRDAVALKLNDGAYSVRVAAIQALARLLPADENLCDAFVLRLNDEIYHVKELAVQALAGLLSDQPNLLHPLVLRLEDPSVYVRAITIELLANVLGDHANLRGAVALRLNDESFLVQVNAIQALAKVQAADSRLRDAIALKLDDDWSVVQVTAIKALAGGLVNNPTLREAIALKLHHSHYDVRAAAIHALAAVLDGKSTLTETVALKLNDPHDAVRVAAIHAFAGLLADNADLRDAVALKLSDEGHSLRAAAIRSLSGSLTADHKLRDTVALKLNDPDDDVRAEAILALAGFLTDNRSLREAVALSLNDEMYSVQAAAIQALAPFVSEYDLRAQLRPALRMDDWETRRLRRINREPRKVLVSSWSQWAMEDPAGRSEAIEMLESEDWRLRLSGAEILMTGGPDLVKHAVPQLLNAMDNHSGLDSWPARIAAAELLINHSQYCQQTIDLLVSALDYAVHPLLYVPMASEIRTSAAVALGKLKAEQYQHDTADKLKAKLQTERDPKVLNSLFNALLSLASAPT